MEKKTHYDWASRKPNEKEYSRTLCGLKDPKLLLKTCLTVEDVNCKRCLNLLFKSK